MGIENIRFLRRIPRLYERALRAVLVVLGLDLAHRHFGTVLGEDDVLLLHLAHAALGELVGVEVDLHAHGRAQSVEFYSMVVHARSRKRFPCGIYEGKRERVIEGRSGGESAGFRTWYPTQPTPATTAKRTTSGMRLPIAPMMYMCRLCWGFFF